MGSITCDFDRRPLIRITFEGEVSDEVFEQQYLAALQELLDRGDKRVMLYDSRKSGMTNAKQRQLQAEWILRNKNEIQANTLGCVFVMESTLHRGILSAILWLQPMPCPHAVVATMGAGLEKANEWLTAAGLAIAAESTNERQVITG